MWTEPSAPDASTYVKPSRPSSGSMESSTSGCAPTSVRVTAAPLEARGLALEQAERDLVRPARAERADRRAASGSVPARSVSEPRSSVTNR